MGIQGLLGYLSKNNLVRRRISISDEVDKWKKQNDEKTPLIVIDFQNLAYCKTKDVRDAICGGRHKKVKNSWKNLLNALKNTGCRLVFFADLNTQTQKSETWMKKQDAYFNQFKKFYNSIDVNIRFERIVSSNRSLKAPNSTFYDMASIAQDFGEFFYSVKYENDLEIARYARDHDAFAIISCDTDFLIFDGNWRLWSSEGICIDPLETMEYDRGGLCKHLQLSRREMALFATIKGNDITKGKPFTMISFDGAAECSRGKVNSNSEIDIKRIFPSVDRETENLIKSSLESYNIEFVTPEIDDRLEAELLQSKNKVYRFYMALINSIQGISIPFYDMKECGQNINLSELIMRWTKRKVGILMQHKQNCENPYKFTIMMKSSEDEPFSAQEVKPIYPDFEVKLRQLYFENTNEIADVNETKWETLSSIMSLSSSEISAIRQLKKEFRLISTLLCSLVKEKLITKEEAGGILHTEDMVRNLDSLGDNYPTSIDPTNVRTANIYNIAFQHVRENFAIAGLLPQILTDLDFDGAYFQCFMNNFNRNEIDRTKRNVMMSREMKFELF